MKKKLLVANWKMQLSHHEACSWIESDLPQVLETLAQTPHELVICPSFTVLPYATSLYEELPWGAQDCYLEERGPFTGDTSVLSLKDLGVRYTLIGHSERRILHGETNDQIRKKATLLLNHAIEPIVCIGETQEHLQDEGSLVKEQITSLLPAYANTARCIIAYEPVWAIGTGKTPTIKELQNSIYRVRTAVSSTNHLLLYGGSVTEAVAREFSHYVDGFLLGGSSLTSEVLKKIILSC